MSILESDLRCKILEAALRYAADWTVFPARPDKRGSYKSAERSGGRAWGATSDPDEIRRDFNRWPDAGIGIPTGTVNGIVVVDYDTVIGHGIDGAAALEDLQDRHGRLPDTLSAITASGSVHSYLRQPGGGIKIKCSNSELGPGIDVKGDGGMVIAPPTAGRRWLNSNPIAEPPAWLVELTKDKQPPPPKRLSIRERAQAAVRQWEPIGGVETPKPMPTLRSNMKSAILPAPHRAAETMPSIALRSVCCSWSMPASSIVPMSNGN
jgi:Bifunctional DNA primase/polymerase, N-terminal